MTECKRKDCVWYNDKFKDNCINSSKVCTKDEKCPAFELDNYRTVEK